MPFKYGIVAVTGFDHLIATFHVEVDGKPQRGWAADHLAPKWFTKDADRRIEDEILEMQEVIHAAGERAVAAGECASVHELWQRIKANIDENLLNNFGISFVERAVIDAVCRAFNQPFAKVARQGMLGVDGSFLPPRPSDSVIARHTVGMADRLRGRGELHDGLPETLEEAIAAYGLTHFKLKLGGDVRADVQRLFDIAAVLDALCKDSYACTLDANENYLSAEPLRELWDRLRHEPSLRQFLSRLLFIEQPLRREVALSDEAKQAFAQWPERPAMIIDESDATSTSFERALDVGYAGTSHKNCKGIFKGLKNARLARERGAILSGEDLTTIGPIALTQDLAVQATLGVGHVERNGHHFFRGLSMFAPGLQQQMVRFHPDLYRMHEDGFATVIIRDGRISTRSASAAPFGTAVSIDEL
jgi:L-alanine-DL-glutamate epimerase-like enolase superfamily enzyme